MGRFGRYGLAETSDSSPSPRVLQLRLGPSASPRDDTVLKKVVGDVVGRKWVAGGELEWDVMGLGEL